jgi:NADH dehydrogenase
MVALVNEPHVVIIGGGFGGLTAAQSLHGAPVRLTLIDSRNHHLFQPLLYQVAMAGLSPAEIAAPIRSVLSRQPNANVLLCQANAIDLDKRTVAVDGTSLHYDYLVLAVGAQNHYFGHDDWARCAVGLKDLDDAVEIRRRVLLAFEAAEISQDPLERQRLLTFVVVGGGPTGVELAGALAELSRFVLARDFRNVDPTAARILLIEGGPRILASFAEKLSQRAVRDLARLGVEVRTDQHVSSIDESGVHIGDQHIPSATVLWAAGVKAGSLTAALPVPKDKGGRILVEPDLTLPGHKEVFAIGDMVSYLHQGGTPLPGVSPVAMQQGRHVARTIRELLKKKPDAYKPFHYLDKGSMATIGRAAAIVQIGRWKLGGFLAWVLWLAVHIFFLITYRNRFAVLFNWAYQYMAYKRGARLITGHRMHPGPAHSGEHTG